MHTNNLILETILVFITILASNGFLYSLTFFDLNQENSTQSTNISYLRNLGPFLIASTPINITQSESNSSQDMTLIESSSSQDMTLLGSSSSQDIYNDILTELELTEEIMAQNQYRLERDATGDIVFSSDDSVVIFKALDSKTILDSQTFEHWREIAMDLHDLPYNTPQGIVQQVKFEELNILYSQDLINFSITQTELRLIIELLPTLDLFKPDINHLILIMLSHYHL